MDDLIIRSLQGLTSKEEEEYLNQRLEGDPDLERWFRSTKAAWDLLEVAAPESWPTPLPDVDVIVARAASTPARPVVGASRTVGRTKWARNQPFLPLRSRGAAAMLAAGVAVATLGLGVLFRSVSDPNGAPSAVERTGAAPDGPLTLRSLERVGPVPTPDQAGEDVIVWPPY
jgi:hypothetical protein